MVVFRNFCTKSVENSKQERTGGRKESSREMGEEDTGEEKERATLGIVEMGGGLYRGE